MDQQTLLPEFEGEQPRITELALSGGSKRRTRPYRMHERLTLVIEVEVVGIGHVETKGGLARRHQVAITDVYELGADRAPSLIEELSDEYDELFGGMAKLPFEPDPQVGEQRDIDGVLCEWQLVDDDESDDGEHFDWVPVPAEPPASDDGTIVPTVELEAMGVGDLVDWVGSSLERARFAAELEQARPKPRAGVTNAVDAIIAAAVGGSDPLFDGGDGQGEPVGQSYEQPVDGDPVDAGEGIDVPPDGTEAELEGDAT